MPGPLDFTFVLCTMAPVFFLEMFAGPLSTDGFVPSGGIGSHKAEDEHSLPLSQHTRSGSATGADSAARAGSTALPSVKPIALQASHTLTPAQQRELERESAYQASTGSTAGTLTDSSAAASGKSKASLPSWGDIAGQTNPGAATGDPTSGKGAQSSGSVGSHTAAELDQDSSSTVKQQSLGDSESDADMEDYDPRAFATGSTDSFSHPADPTGQVWDPRTAGASSESRVRPSMGGEEEYGQEGDSRHFMVNRDPADPRSVVRAQQDRAQAGQHHGAGVGAGGTGVTSPSPPCCPPPPLLLPSLVPSLPAPSVPLSLAHPMYQRWYRSQGCAHTLPG